ncbi:hypothetical protein OIO90_003557 [Microbotryomycetes sp. JL221]|nr:hypothetical protein OIO90_003557 [Microbotryomycetes sp. JL221]
MSLTALIKRDSDSHNEETPWPNGHLPLSITIAYLIMFVLVGIVLHQTSTWASHCVFVGNKGLKKDSKWYQVLVWTMLLFLLAHAGMAAETIIEGILGEENSPPLGAELTAQSVLIFVPIVLSQVWQLWRVWVVSHRNVAATAIGGTIVTSSIVTFVLYLAMRGGENMLLQQNQARKWYLSYAVTTVAADFTLSVMFVLFAVKLRSKAFDDKTKSSIASMYNVSIQAAVPTAICSIGMMAAAGAHNQLPLFLAFQGLLPALDTIAVLFTLYAWVHAYVERRAPVQVQVCIENDTQSEKGICESLSEGSESIKHHSQNETVSNDNGQNNGFVESGVPHCVQQVSPFADHVNTNNNDCRSNLDKV